MKSVVLSVFAIILIAGISCNGQQTQKKSESVVASADAPVEVIYFHTTSRCVTCKTVEAEAKSNVALLYSEQVNDGKISFTSYNIEEPEGKEVAKRVGVEGQSLMIVKGDQKENVINDGFLYAVRQPEKFREIMKEKIDPLLK
jgi:hypothetical protein